MLKLRSYSRRPPCRWQYLITREDLNQPITIHGQTFMDLCQRVRRVYTMNKWEQPSDLNSLIEHQIASNSPNSFVVQPRDPASNVALEEKCLEGIRELRRNAHRLTRPQEATRRAGLCCKCHKNAYMYTSCMECSGMWKRLVGALGKMRTFLDNRLFSCSVSGRANAIDIYLPDDAITKLDANITRDLYPAACWKHPIMEKAHGTESSTESS